MYIFAFYQIPIVKTPGRRNLPFLGLNPMLSRTLQVLPPSSGYKAFSRRGASENPTVSLSREAQGYGRVLPAEDLGGPEFDSGLLTHWPYWPLDKSCNLS